ncbi:MAG TPA: M20/M25/M40 family metallo-hydrolase, partial [Thermoanaerobaculia bacterium]
MNRRDFLEGVGASAAILALPATKQSSKSQSSNLAAVFTEIPKRHDEAVKRLQDWIHQPSIAAEKNGMEEGNALLIQMLKDAGFQTAVKVPTDGQPGVFATLDAGAAKSVGIYFMYDVKQVDPSEWSSPPWEARIVDKEGFGKVVVGRGAVNQKGPEAAFLAALHAFRGANRKLPVNLVLVAEGEEEIGSPHFREIVRRPEVQAALSKTSGVFMPSASQGADGVVQVSLGAKGVVELELVSTGEKWGRGPQKDIHSSNKARVDSPAWHLVQALHTLVTENGEPAVDGFADHARPISAAEKAMVAEGARRFDEAVLKRSMGVQHW